MIYRGILLLFILVIAVILTRLVQKKRIKEKYIWLWLSLDFFALLGTIFPSLVDKVAHMLGFEVTSNMVLVAVISVLVFIQIHQSVTVTRLEEDRRVLTEEVALLQYELHSDYKENKS